MPGRAPDPSRSSVDDDGGDETFYGIMIGYLRFSEEGVYMGEGATLVEAPRPHTTWRRRGDLRHHMVWWKKDRSLPLEI